MKLIVLLFSLLILNSYANQALFKELAKIHEDPFGATILSAISVNLKAKTPISEIGELLDSIRDDLLAQSQKFEAETAEANDALIQKISGAQTLEAIYEDVIAALQSIIENAQSDLSNGQDSLAENQQFLGQEQQAVQDRDAAAAVDIPRFESDIQDLNNAIEACGQAISKMQNYKQSSEQVASFIQIGTAVKDRLKKVTDTIYGMKKTLAKHSNMFTPLTRELIDLTATLDQSKADKVIDLLTQLLNVLKEAESTTQSDKATYVSNYEDAQAASQQRIADYQATIEGLQTKIQNLQTKIDQAQQDLANAQQNLADTQDLLNSLQQTLEQLQADYAVRRPRFDNLILLIRKIIEFFQQNISSVDEYVSSVANGTDA